MRNIRTFLALSASVVFGLSMVACGGADLDSDSELKVKRGPPYLALGDSISFGYTPLTDVNQENVDSGLFVGYPEILADLRGFDVSNASCTGESSGSMIDISARDNGCNSGDDPMVQYLKVKHDGSQLDYALTYLHSNPGTQLVTVSIGGNDLLLTEDECNATMVPAVCKALKLPGIAINFGKNVVTIAKAIRGTGYQGPLVFVTNYARDYKDAISGIALGLFQTELKTLAAFHKFKVASGFDAFKAASKDFDGDACEAGLLIALPEGGCNQHPSEKGAEILAHTVLDVLR